MSRRPTSAAARARAGRASVLATAVTAAAIDLGAKATSESRLADSTVDLGLIQLQLAYNSGVAFSVGNRLPIWVIVAVTGTLSLALIAYAWRRAPRAGWVERIAGGAVIGGAVANLVDRAGDGVVTDYLHTGWWPTFNLADTFIVVGFIVIALLHARPEQTAGETQEPAAQSHSDTTDTTSS